MDRRSLHVALTVLLLALVALGASLTREPRTIIERPVQVPGPEQVVTVKVPAQPQEKPLPAFTARQVSDLTARRLAKVAKIAQARRNVAALIATLSTDGHRFPDNSVIKARAGSKKGGEWHPGRFTYEEWARHKAQRENRHIVISEDERYQGEELSPGNWNEYDFEKIERHAGYLWDPEGNADLKVKWWPGARYKSWSFKPDTYETRLIGAHHAVWKVEIELKQVEAELDRLGE